MKRYIGRAYNQYIHTPTTVSCMNTRSHVRAHAGKSSYQRVCLLDCNSLRFTIPCPQTEQFMSLRVNLAKALQAMIEEHFMKRKCPDLNMISSEYHCRTISLPSQH